jgi:hypothetical protein
MWLTKPSPFVETASSSQGSEQPNAGAYSESNEDNI